MLVIKKTKPSKRVVKTKDNVGVLLRIEILLAAILVELKKEKK